MRDKSETEVIAEAMNRTADAILGNNAAVERLARGGRTGSVSGRSLISDTGPVGCWDPNARDLLTDQQRAIAAHADFEFDRRSVFYGRGDMAAGALSWLRISAKSQSRKASFHELERLSKLTDALGVETKAALQEDTESEGGHAVPVTVGREVLRLIEDGSDIFPLARRWPMTSKVHDIVNEATACEVHWVDEEATLTEGNPTFGKTVLTATKLAGRSTFSLELLDDSNVALLPFLLSLFTERMGGELDFQAVEGSGSPFTGIVGASGVNAIATTTATAGDDLVYADLVALYVAGGERRTRDEGIWVMSPAVFGKVLSLTDSNGQPIVRFGDVEGAPKRSLFGRPVFVSNRLGSFTVGSDATGNIYFGPPSALSFGVRRMFTWDVTDQVNWATYQGDARLVGRFAYAVGVPAAWTRLTKIHND